MKTLNKAALLSAAALAVAVGGTAVAQGMGDGGRHAERGAMMGHQRGEGRMGMHGGPGGRMGGFDTLIEAYDTNGDGAVGQEEIDAARQARLSEFDANGDGSLGISEYEALWLDAMRDRMADQFQAHDDDGDGAVTGAEFGEDYAGMVAPHDRNGDGVLNADDTGRATDRDSDADEGASE